MALRPGIERHLSERVCRMNTHIDAEEQLEMDSLEVISGMFSKMISHAVLSRTL
jgi:hypothetical protein